MLENIFKWGRGKAESELAPSAGLVSGAEKPESGIDISVPMFHFTEKERAEMKAEGMSDDEIDMRESDVVNRLARGRNN